MEQRLPIGARGIFVFALMFELLFFAWSSAQAGEARAKWQEDWEQSREAAKKEGKVVVYFWEGGNLDKAILAFNKRYPDIPVSALGSRGSNFITRIVTEMRAGKYLADVCLCGVTSPYKVLYKQNALEPLKPALLLPEVIDESKWWQGKHHFQDGEGKYIHVYRGEPAGSRVFYNIQLVKPADFTSYWDILQPKWKGKIVAIDPNESTGGWRQLYYNPAVGPEFVRRLLSEMDITLSRDDRQATDWLANGRFAIGFFVTGIPEAKKQGLPLAELPTENLKEPVTLYSGPNGTLALMKQAPHPSAAKVFINWFLSREGQTIFQEIMNTSLDQAESMRDDIPKDPIPAPYRRKKGTEYISMFTPERMDADEVLKLYKEIVKR
jgi:iron(III) transport system substrate-binding protein